MAEAQDSFQEKTEEPTSKRIEDSRRKGSVARSAELNSALLLMAGLLVIIFGGGMVASALGNLLRLTLGGLSHLEFTPTTAHAYMLRVLTPVAMAMVPLLLVFVAVGLVSGIVQVGFLFSLEPLQPQWSRLNPIKGIRKLFLSRRSAVELTKNLLKIMIVGIFSFVALESAIDDVLAQLDGDVQSLSSLIMSSATSVAMKATIAYLALALLDLLYQRYEHSQELRMTKQEVKEEGRQLEGDPVVKGRIRTVQRQIAYKRMMHEVPRADVVVTNPTHYAVALKYDAARMAAPTVVAKGADLLAERIRSIATEHNVPIVEDPPLARQLYRLVDVGETIPEKMFQAVAQILAYVYRLKAHLPAW